MGKLHPLEQAAIDVREAADGKGLRIFLMPATDMFSVDKVRAEARKLADNLFGDGNCFIGPNAEYAAAKNLALLANLLAENIRERDSPSAFA